MSLWRALALGILLAVDVSGAQVPERILRARNDKVASRLAQHIAVNLLDDTRRIPDSRVPFTRWFVFRRHWIFSIT